MTSSLQRLNRLLELLENRAWTLVRQNTRFSIYSPPVSDSRAGDYELLVPRNPAVSDFGRALDNSIAALASYYQAPFTSIEALLLESSEVLSLRMDGEGFTGGAAPFPQFERMLEHLKRTLTRTAAFVITDDPVEQSTPAGARRFLDDCWFMQTARGSFVTRVAIPTTGSFDKTPTLFTKPIERAAVGITIRRVADLVGERVLEGDMDLLTDAGFNGIREIVSVGVLEEMAKLFRGSGARTIAFSFDGHGHQHTAAMPPLNSDRLELLDRFIVHVKDRLQATFALNVEGRVFEVRRSRRRSSSSIVGLLAEIEHRQEFITFKVEPDVLPIFLELFRSGQLVHVQGVARRMRTQIRIDEDFSFDEI